MEPMAVKVPPKSSEDRCEGNVVLMRPKKWAFRKSQGESQQAKMKRSTAENNNASSINLEFLECYNPSRKRSHITPYQATFESVMSTFRLSGGICGLHTPWSVKVCLFSPGLSRVHHVGTLGWRYYQAETLENLR